MNAKKISREELQKMRDGMSTRDIAKTLGISLPTVYKLLREADIKIGGYHKIKLVD